MEPKPDINTATPQKSDDHTLVIINGVNLGFNTKAHGEAEAERLAVVALAILRLPADTQELAKLRKGDGRKVLVACLLRQRTAAGNPWIAKRLAMGHSGSVSRLVVAAAKHPPTVRKLEKLGKLLKCGT